MSKTPDYRDVMGRYRTLSLFVETNNDAEPPVFTLKPRDHKGCKSMKNLYMECEDPTEYTFAIEVLGSWEHWLKLSGAEWFQEYIVKWRDELEVRLRSKGVKQLKDAAAKGDRVSAKFLAEKGWDKRAGAGRPTKAEIEKERMQRSKISSTLEDDADRIGLKH